MFIDWDICERNQEIYINGNLIENDRIGIV